MSDTNFDFNDAEQQRSFDVIPDNTICVLQINIRPGGIGPGGWEKKAADGASEGVDCEFTVIEPKEHAKRRFFQRMTLRGTTPGHAEAGKITRDQVRAFIESARGIQPNDNSEAAKAARKIAGWHEVDGLRLMARLGVRPPSNGYDAKNSIREVITPDKTAWHKVEQVARPPQSGNTAGSTAPASTPPANSISRPDWAA